MQARTLSEIAELCGAALEGDGNRRIVGPASLAEARPDQVSFLAQARYTALLETTRAGAVIVRPDVESRRPDLDLLRSADPNSAFTEVIRAFAPPPERSVPGVHPSAVVHPEAELGAEVSIGPGCVIGRAARIGARSVLVAQVHVGPRAIVGADSVLHPCVVLYEGVQVGARCLLHAGVVLGADGFGFDPTATGWRKIPQCGTVEVGDDVELGAGTAVDRARFGATRIGNGVKIDNMVQVGHNCVIEDGALICAQVGLAGSVTVGSGAVLGGKVAVNGHLTIGPRVQIAAFSGVHGDLEGDQQYFGIPARPSRSGMKIMQASARVPRLLEQVRELERRVRELEGEGT